MKNSRDIFLSAPEKNLSKLVEEYKEALKDNRLIENEYVKDHISIAKRLESKGVNVFFVVGPRQYFYGLHPVLNLSNQLKAKGFKVIDISNPEIFPELYKVENSFDLTHLYNDGPEIYTRRFYEEYQKIKN